MPVLLNQFVRNTVVFGVLLRERSFGYPKDQGRTADERVQADTCHARGYLQLLQRSAASERPESNARYARGYRQGRQRKTAFKSREADIGQAGGKLQRFQSGTAVERARSNTP